MRSSDHLTVIHLSKTGGRYYAPYLSEHLKPATWFCAEETPLHPSAIVRRFPTFHTILSAISATTFQLPVLTKAILEHVKTHQGPVLFTGYHIWNAHLIVRLKKLGVPIIVTVHDVPFHAGERSRIDEIRQWRCIELADRVVTLSDFVATQIRKKIVDVDIETIPHGLVYPNMAPTVRVLPSKFQILMTGRLKKYKGVDLFCKAISQIPKEFLKGATLAGKGYVSSSCKNSSIHIINEFVPDEEHKNLLINHDILVLPYTEASQSGVIAAGISAAIPMVITRVGGLPEQLSEEEAVIVEPNVSSIKEGILDLIKDPERFDAIHHNLLQKRSLLQWEPIAHQFKAAIYSMA